MSTLFRFSLAATLLALSACASPDLRLYDGAAKPAAEIAVITMPEQLEVATINGAEVPGAQGMWNRGDKRLEVVPGRYEALVYYREVWNANGESDVLRSRNPAKFTIDAQAGHTYRIDYPHPASHEDAKKFAQNFNGWVEDKTAGTRVASTDSGVEFQGGIVAQVTGDTTLVAAAAPSSAASTGGVAIQPLATKPAPAATAPLAATSTVSAPAAVSGATVSAASNTVGTVAAAGAGAATVAVPKSATPAAAPTVAATTSAPAAANDRDWVGLMKGWWKQASPEERREFLRWVGDQP